ncbi:unnamed protein product [Effrenium voratum]|nr:unnamed protein product [Effrenium voratum]
MFFHWTSAGSTAYGPGTALYCVQAPPTGGATCFADAAAAWDALPELQKQRLRNLECICSLAHHDAKIRRRNPDYPMSQTRQRQRVPLALEHPETKRVALYGINSSTCWIVERGQEISSKRLEWLEESGEEDESVEMLQELLVHATAPEFTVVWQWQPGDFAICDTRSTLHCATSYDERYLREMWRTRKPLFLPQAAPVVQEDKKAVVAEPISIDEMFGCINGSLQESPSGYLLYCPRTVEQSRRSWWSPEGLPRRRPGQKLPGQHCWQEGFDFGICCGEQWGPEGNKECWDDIHNYTTCCIEPG